MASLKLAGAIREMWVDDEGLHVLTDESCLTFKSHAELETAILEREWNRGKNQ